MDELQATFIKNKLFFWGLSSNINEIFTPIERLSKIYGELFASKKISRATKDTDNSSNNVENSPKFSVSAIPKQFDIITRIADIEIPSTNNIPIMPESLKLFYNQLDTVKAASKTFSISGIELTENLMINFLQSERKQGILFGDSYEFFKLCLKFAFSLIARQRFVPYCKNQKSFFILNFDNNEDSEIFDKLVRKAPLSIKQKIKDNTKDIVYNALEYFVDLIIFQSLEKIDLKNETETDKWLNGFFDKKINTPLKIQQGLDEWLAAKKINRNLDYNMLFKLQEPEEDSEEWKLTFNIQSKKDKSLIISLDKVWQNKCNLKIPNIKSYVLSDLGCAANSSKTVEKALYKPNPYNVFLSNDEAMEFISRDSVFLNDLGFTTQIPKITHSKLGDLKVKVKLKVPDKFKIEGTGMLGTALFDFDYKVSIGNVELSEREFYELSRSKEKLVKIKDKWVEVNSQDIKKLKDYFEKKKRLSLHDTFVSNIEEGIQIDDVIVPNEFNDEVKGLFNFSDLKKLSVSDKLSGELRDYQKHGFSWMAFLKNLGFGGILADDMGLGKTIQTISYLLSHNKKPSLIICPTSILNNWFREIQKFAPSLKCHIHHGAKRLTAEKFEKESENYDLIITSYNTVRIDEKIFSEIGWENVILDEAQNIKNPFTKQSISINKLKAKNRFCLTGTPIENRLSELWSIMNFANPGFLSVWKTFKKNFAEPIELHGNKAKAETLNKVISPFILRRLKSDKNIIKDLPKKTEVKEYCTLNCEQASLYQAVVDDSLKKIQDDGEKRRALIMAALIKLKQICNHPTNYLKDSKKLEDRSGKVTRLREMVEVFLSNNEKCLIFTQYKEMGELLKSDLQEYFDTPVCFLHGGQSTKQRQQLIDYFQKDEGPKIFILSLKAGGVGINLTKANHVIHFDRWWNPAVENQATDRAFRIGQTKDVFVYKFITTGTIEERIDEMIERKMGLSDSVLSKSGTGFTELDDKGLKELFSLRRENLT